MRSRWPIVQVEVADRKPVRDRWSPADVVALVVVLCYGAAALIVAAGLFVRLASHP
jgi:hypothetical protein